MVPIEFGRMSPFGIRVNDRCWSLAEVLVLLSSML